MSAPWQRWDTDTRGRGITNGAWIAPSVRQLLEALDTPDWIAEDPDAHLLPQLQRAGDAPASPWHLERTEISDGLLTVYLVWDRPEPRLGHLRRDLFALLGTIAEATTYVRQRIGETSIAFEVTTGMLAGDSPFAGHGHLLRFQVSGPAVEQMIAGTRLEETPPT